MIGWCSRCGNPWCDEHDCCALECTPVHLRLSSYCLGKTVPKIERKEANKKCANSQSTTSPIS